MTESEFISKIVLEFYKKATTDFLIGYQFRKIAQFEGHDPLRPPIDAFSHHLPRIESFWQIQLLNSTVELERPFDLIGLHRPLNIKKGEINRWVLLLEQTLDEFTPDELHGFKENWINKIDQFRNRLIGNLLQS